MEKDIVEQIFSVINSELYGIEYYTKEELVKLCNEIINLKNKNILKINQKDNPKTIIKKINNFVIQIVNVRREYFYNFMGKEDFKYRTAYGALIEKNAICIGYAELTRILLEIYGIKGYTMLAVLPYRQDESKAIHYFNVAEIVENDGRINYIPIDAEREASRIRKGDNFEKYKEKMLITYPNDTWINNKVGITGLGIKGSQYMNDIDVKYYGMSRLPLLMSFYKLKRNKDHLINMDEGR